MRQPVQESSGEPLAAQNVYPLFEREVGGDDDAGAFVGPADDLEEEFGEGPASAEI